MFKKKCALPCELIKYQHFIVLTICVSLSHHFKKRSKSIMFFFSLVHRKQQIGATSGHYYERKTLD